MTNIEEIWKDVPSLEGILQASNLGNVRSLTRRVKSNRGNTREIKGRVIYGFPSPRGLMISWGINDQQAKHYIVASCWIQDRPKNCKRVRHKDGDKFNNHPDNLEWVDRLDSYYNQFYKKVMPEPNTGCWIWTAKIQKNGYGAFKANSKKNIFQSAHRASFIIHKGEIPDGLLVRHTCDNPWCVNPDHLILGTQKDNMQDKIRRGRIRLSPKQKHKSV